MPFDGNGNWTSNFNAEADRDAGYKILASRFDNILLADLAQSFENCLTKDTQIKPQQNFNANNYRIINVADPVDNKDAVNKQTMDTEISTADATAVHKAGTETITGDKTFSRTITGDISGNAGTVTNGVYTTGNQTIGGTKTFSSTISGSITGNAGTVTNGVYTTGNQTIGGTKTFSSTISGSITGNAGTVTNGVYTNTNQTISGNKTFSGTNTFTGSNTFNSNITVKMDKPKIFCDDDDETWATDPATDGNAGGYEVRDSNGAWGTLFRAVKYTNGRRAAGVQVRGKDMTTQASFDVSVDSGGGTYASATPGVKSSIVGWVIPDYSAGVSVAWDNTVSITGNGYVVYEFKSGGGGADITISINGVNVYLMTADYNNKHSGIVPVGKGDTFKATGTNVNVHNLTFYPCVGG